MYEANWTGSKVLTEAGASPAPGRRAALAMRCNTSPFFLFITSQLTIELNSQQCSRQPEYISVSQNACKTDQPANWDKGKGPQSRLRHRVLRD